MKYLLLTLSILLLSSCQEYRYDVTYEKCNGQTDSTSYINNEFMYPSISTYKVAVPILNAGKSILNVCDFSYTRTEIK